jgi:tape measure domain-containing protein
MADTASFTLNVNSREGVAALEAFAKAAERAAHSGKQVEEQSHAAGRGMSTLAAGLAGGIAGAAANVLADMGRASLQASKDLFTSSVSIATSRQSIEASFKAILGSALEADRAMSMIRTAASKPGLTFDSAMMGTQKMLGAGFNLDTAVKVVTLFGNAAALAGVGIEEMNGAMLGFSQIISKGKAEQEDMNQILERFPMLGKEIEKQFGGKTAEAINKASKSVDDMAQKFIAAMAAMPKGPDLMGNAMLNLKNQAADVKTQFGSGFVDQGAIDSVNRLSDEIRGMVPIAKEVGKALSDALEWALKKSMDAFDSWKSGATTTMWQYSMPGMAGMTGAVPTITAPTPDSGAGGLRMAERRLGIEAPWEGPTGLSDKAKKEKDEEEKRKRLAQRQKEEQWLQGKLDEWNALHPGLEASNPFADRLRAASMEVAKINGPAAVSTLAARTAQDTAKRNQESQKDYIRRLKAAIAMADPANGGDMQLINKLGSGPDAWFSGGLEGAKLALRDAEYAQAKGEGSSSVAELALSQMKEQQRAAREAAAEKVRNAQAAVGYFRAELDGLEKANAGYEAMAAAIESVRAAEMNLKELRLAEAMLGASPLAQGTARMEEQKEDLRIRREASDRLLNAGMSVLRNQADIAGLRGELSDSPVEQAAAWDAKRAALVQEIALLAGRNDKIRERLQLQLELKRMDEEERGRMTRGQELLHASLGGGGALEQFVKRQGGTFGVVGDSGPAFDWSRLTGATSYRGDVLDGGVLGQVQEGIMAGMAASASPLANAVAAATQAGMGTVTRAVGVG